LQRSLIQEPFFNRHAMLLKKLLCLLWNPATLTILTVIVLPLAVRATVTTTSFIIDNENNFGKTHSYNTTTTYTLESALESLTGTNSTTSYNILTGSGFRYFCGDGFIDTGETCDASNLNGATCVSQGFVGGAISCNSTCTALDTSSCTASTTAGGGGGGGGSSGAISTGDVPAAPGVGSTFTSTYYTYQSTDTLYGTMASGATITVNSSSTSVTYPSATTWSAHVTLSEGDNVFRIVAKNSAGSSSTSTVTVHRRYNADVNDDGKINDYDLSKLVRLWNSTDKSADFNADGIVDDYDFSIFVSRWR